MSYQSRAEHFQHHPPSVGDGYADTVDIPSPSVSPDVNRGEGANIYVQRSHNESLKKFLRRMKVPFILYDFGLALAVVWLVFVAEGYGALGVLTFFGLIILGFSGDALISSIAPEGGGSELSSTQAKRAMFTLLVICFFYASDGALIAHKVGGYDLTGFIKTYALYGTFAQGFIVLLLTIWVYRSSAAVKAEEEHTEIEALLYMDKMQADFNEKNFMRSLGIYQRQIGYKAMKKVIKESSGIIKGATNTYREQAKVNTESLIRDLSYNMFKPVKLLPSAPKDTAQQIAKQQSAKQSPPSQRKRPGLFGRR